MKIKSEEKKRRLNSKVLIIIAAMLVIALAVVLFLMFNSKDNKAEIEKSLTEMGKSFYENFYYEQIGSSSDERTTLLSKFTTIGIKIDLENLERYNDGEFSKEIKTLKNKKTNKMCNKTKTKVIIYPKSPYGKTDYTIKTELDCGFDSNK